MEKKKSGFNGMVSGTTLPKGAKFVEQPNGTLKIVTPNKNKKKSKKD